MDKHKDTGFSHFGDNTVPDDIALGQSRRLVEHIHHEIDGSGGRISFRRFMEMALYEPGLGYYSAGSRKFGAEGDFTTAPELSSLFSICIARQCEQVLRETGTGTVLELGAGTGIMACDILAEMRRRDVLPEHYLILETSADLRARQQQLLKERLPDLFDRVRWLDGLAPGSVSGVILANEVLDALPVNRIKIVSAAVHELMVAWEGDSFAWRQEPVNAGWLSEAEKVLSDWVRQLPDGYVTEFNSLLRPFIGTLADALVRGTILLIDYGYPRREYYHPQRTDGTLLCYYRHRRHDDPFLYVGLQDISASVDFTLVAESARSAGLDLAGFATQSSFLVSCDLDDIIRQYSAGDDRKLLHYSQQAGQLILPGEMGENFKVMALGRGIRTPLMGFQFSDHTHRL